MSSCKPGKEIEAVQLIHDVMSVIEEKLKENDILQKRVAELEGKLKRIKDEATKP